MAQKHINPIQSREQVIKASESNFTELYNTVGGSVVNSIGGKTGAITLGTGLQIDNSKILSVDTSVIAQLSDLSNYVDKSNAQTISGTKTFSANQILNNNIALQGKNTGGTAQDLIKMNNTNKVVVGNGGTDVVANVSGALVPSVDVAKDLGNSSYKWRYLYLSSAIKTASYTFNLPTANGTLALQSEIPTAVSQLTNDSGYLTSSDIDQTYDGTSANAQSGVAIAGALSPIISVAQGKTASYVIQSQSDITGTKDANDEYTNVTAITGVTISDLAVGDIILVKDLNVPDYWVSQISPSVSLNKMETTKVDLSNYVDKTTAQTITGTKTFSLIKLTEQGTMWTPLIEGASAGSFIGFNQSGQIGFSSNATTPASAFTFRIGGVNKFRIGDTNIRPETDNAYDLGTSSNRFKDLYLSGGIKNGTLSWTMPSSSGTLALTSDIPTINYPVTDVQINGTSIVSSKVANFLTNTAYNSSTNKIATMSDLPTNYVTTNTAQTISGDKTFTNRPKVNALFLPSEYQAVEYIQSSGTQYINTGYIAKKESGIEVEYSYVANGNAGISGIYQGSSPRTDTLFITTNSGQTSSNVFMASRGNIVDTGENVSLNTKYITSINFLNNNSFILNGTSYGAVGTNDVVARNIILFGRDYNGSYALSSSKIYKCTISEGSKIVRNLIPCYRKSDTTIGMYDVVNGVFYTNAGSGTFTKGNDINGVSEKVAILSDIPTIPTNISVFTNDAGYLTSATGVTSVNGSSGAITDICTLNTAQTISGQKTFSNDIIINNGKSIKFKDSGGTARQSIRMSTNNRLEIGYNSGINGIDFMTDAYLPNAKYLYGRNASNVVKRLIGITSSNNVFINPDATGNVTIESTVRPNTNASYDLGLSTHKWRDIYLSGAIKDGTYTFSLPSSTGTLALTSDLPTVNNATLTIQKNGTNVATFTANASSNATANITVPVNTSDLNNDSGFLTSAVTTIGGKSGTITLGSGLSIDANGELSATATGGVTSIGGKTGAITLTSPLSINASNQMSVDLSNCLKNNAQGTITANAVTPLYLKGNSDVSTIYIGFKNQSGTTLGAFGADINKHPVFYSDAYGEDKILALEEDVPTNTSDLYNDSGFITSHQSIKTLDTTATTAQTTSASESITGSGTIKLHKVAKTGTYSDLIGTPTIPTKVSDLSNDSGFITGITSTDVTTALGYTPYNSSNPNGYITSSALASYLPLAGGTMTGVINTPINAPAINLRTGHASYNGIISYRTSGNEAVCFDVQNAVTSFIFRTYDSRSNTSQTWNEVTPSMQIKNQRVTINKLIANGSDASYNLDVNGTANATTLYENGTALSSKYVAWTLLATVTTKTLFTSIYTSSADGYLLLVPYENTDWYIYQDTSTKSHNGNLQVCKIVPSSSRLYFTNGSSYTVTLNTGYVAYAKVYLLT